MNKQMVAAITGGGAKWVGDYLAVGGRSSHFLEAIVPYAGESLDQFLGRRPDKYCSAETASAMAMRCFERAGQLKPDSDAKDRLGVGVTASLYKEGQREGRVNQIFIAAQTIDASSVATYQLHDQNREQQENWASKLIKSELFLAWDDALKYLPSIHISFKNRVTERIQSDLIPVFTGEAPHLYLSNNDIKDGPRVVFSSSCNPFHIGHQAMAEYAKAHFPDHKVYCELSIKNFEKPTVDYISLSNRLKSIPPRLFDDIIVSNTSHYTEKAKSMPGTVFAMGSDTLNRIDWQRDRGIFERTNTKFLVFPRTGIEVQDKSRMYDKLVLFAYDFEPSHHSSTEIRRCMNQTKNILDE